MALDQSFIARQAELQRLGFQVLQADYEKLIASRRSFYWDCLLTWMNYTVFLRRVTTLSAQLIDLDRPQLKSEAKQLNRSPLPRGFQSGNAILVVYLADQVEHEAQKICEQSRRLEFAQFYVPAAIDLSNGATYFVRHTPMWGAVYYGKFRYILARLISPQEASNQEPLSTSGVIMTLLMLGFFAIVALLLLVVAVSG